MQSLGSLLLGIEAFACVVPDIYIGTLLYRFQLSINLLSKIPWDMHSRSRCLNGLARAR